MTRISPYSEDAPGISGEPVEDDRIPKRVADLMERWEQDPLVLAAAADHVTGETSWSDTLPEDIAALMIGHPDDQSVRDLRFVEDLRGRVMACLRKWAEAQAEAESANWIPWREELRRRMK